MSAPDDLLVRPAAPEDAEAWLGLRAELWPGEPSAELADEVRAWLADRPRDDREVLLAQASGGAVVGFAELSVRPFAEGCRSDRVGYLEGWYVDPGHRGRGVGRALVEAALDWARRAGCTEFASDTEVDNRDSQAAHGALGFSEVGRLVLFRRAL